MEPCYQGGKKVYVGSIFKDPVIRGKENPYFGHTENLHAKDFIRQSAFYFNCLIISEGFSFLDGQ